MSNRHIADIAWHASLVDDGLAPTDWDYRGWDRLVRVLFHSAKPGAYGETMSLMFVDGASAPSTNIMDMVSPCSIFYVSDGAKRYNW